MENDPDQKVRFLFEYVRDKIETRYDYDSYRVEHKNINELLEKGYGNVTEKNSLLVALIKASGINASPLLIGTRDFASFDPKIHQLSQFNRIVCYIDNELVIPLILDTDQTTTVYPFLPTRSIIAGGLLLIGEKSYPIKIKHFKRKSGYNIYSQVTLQQDGSAICTTFASVKGYNMIRFEKYFIDSLPPEELISEFCEYDEGQMEIIKLERNRDDIGDSIYLNFVIEIPEFATVIDNNLFFSTGLGSPGMSPFISTKRFFPVDFRYKYTINKVTIFNLQENMTISDTPSNLSNSTPNHQLRMNRTIFKSKDSIRIVKKLSIGKSAVYPGEYPTLKKIMDSYYESGMDQIAVTIN